MHRLDKNMCPRFGFFTKNDHKSYFNLIDFKFQYFSIIATTKTSNRNRSVTTNHIKLIDY